MNNIDFFDAIIIGFGKGGKTLAAFLAKKGWKVAVIEESQQMYGGTCINIACIPTKSLSHSAELSIRQHFAAFLEQQEYYQHSLEEKDALVSFLRQKNYDNLHQYPNVSIIDGKASFLSPDQLEIQLRDGGQMIVQAERIFINTGTLPCLPPIDGLMESQRTYTSTSMLELSQRPENLVIIGGGYIGLEFASMYAAFGSKVTILEKRDGILPEHDPDIIQNVKSTLEKQGVRFLFKKSVQQIKDHGQRTHVLFADDTAEQHELVADAILVAVGRTANTPNLHLERAGVEIDKRGFIPVDDLLRTNIPHIWALGDVNGGPQFTYISLDDFRIIRDQLFGTRQYSRSSRQNVPYSVFIYPTLSWVGLTEKQARSQGYELKVATFPGGGIPRSRLLQQPDGILKAIVDAKTDRILGVTLFSQDSSEVINIVKLAIDAQVNYQQLRDMIYTHPSMAEGLNDLFSQIKEDAPE